MKKKNVTKEDILSMIRDDLKACKVTTAIKTLGFENDTFGLEISDTIIRLMGINTDDKRIDGFMNGYMELTERIATIDINNDEAQLNALALEIYNYLKDQQKTCAV